MFNDLQYPSHFPITLFHVIPRYTAGKPQFNTVIRELKIGEGTMPITENCLRV